MKRATITGHSAGTRSFSLLEVVIALGVITVGVVGVLAVFPTALQTGHSAQDETRAAHIAQSVFGSLVAGATSQFNNAGLPPTPVSIDLTASSSPTSPTLYADTDGNLIPNSTNAAYAIFVYTNNSVPGFTDPGTANLVTVRVAWPANAPAANQTFRDYVRIISKY
jgi:uncharacterized protein (TIGR02598 family)